MLAPSITTYTRQNRSPGKPNEDAIAVQTTPYGAVVALADGVTRSVSAQGTYPSPSGAVLAAQTAVQTLTQELTVENTRAALARALSQANERIVALNESAGVQSLLNYADHDWWGTCALAVTIGDGTLRWAHIGDSALLRWRAPKFQVFTRDQVRHVSPYVWSLPQDVVQAAGGETVYARKMLRNKPDHPMSYGVLTGEDAALGYCEFGTTRIRPGDRYVLVSDGCAALNGGDTDWRAMASAFSEPDLVAHVPSLVDLMERREDTLKLRSDDKTIAIVQF